MAIPLEPWSPPDPHGGEKTEARRSGGPGPALHHPGLAQLSRQSLAHLAGVPCSPHSFWVETPVWMPGGGERSYGNPRPCGRAGLSRDWFSQSGRTQWAGQVCTA